MKKLTKDIEKFTKGSATLGVGSAVTAKLGYGSSGMAAAGGLGGEMRRGFGGVAQAFRGGPVMAQPRLAPRRKKKAKKKRKKKQ